MTELASKDQLRGSLLRWALFLVPAVLLLGFLSEQIGGSGPENRWFSALAKPSLYPPPAVFGMVRSVLYVLMGFAMALVAAARGAHWRLGAIGAFIIQLTLNLAWSPLFFAGHQIVFAFALMIALDFAVLVTMVLFRRVRPVAAVLMLPYLAWILFATLLTWQFHAANPGADGREVSGAVTRVQI